MGIFNGRGPSRADLGASFAIIAFPLHVWTVINILQIVPAWLLRLSVWELAGAVSYALAAVLIESTLLWAALVGLGVFLPRKWLTDKFVALSGILAWVVCAWAALAQFFFDKLLQWGAEILLLGLLAVAVSFALAYKCVVRSKRVENWVKQLAQRLSVLVFAYVVFDLLGLAVILFRNLVR